MNLEMDLIREILKWCNDNLPDNEKEYITNEIDIPNFTVDQIDFHFKLLIDAGYINGTYNIDLTDTFNCIPLHLTLGGYEFYESTKDDTIWNGMKDVAGKIGIQIITDAIPIFLQIVSKQLGLT
jgi:hypothetical protein